MPWPASATCGCRTGAGHASTCALRLQDLSCAREGSLRHILLAQTYLQQDRPEVDHAVSLATRAVETLSGEVDSARCVRHLARLVGDFVPYRRRPAVRQLTEQATELFTSH